MPTEQEIGLISVVMAAYNAEKTLEEAVRSVLAQTYPHWELLIVEDGSTDGTLQLAERLAGEDDRIRLLPNGENRGTSLTRHRGFQEARGEWIAILDSDDRWAPDKLEKQTARQRETGGELLFTGSAFLNEEGALMDWRLRVPQTIGYRQLLKQNLISNSSVLVRRELLLRHEAMGDGMHEDFADWLGILKDGYTAYGVDEPLLLYRLSSGSKSGNKLKAARMNWNTYRYVGLNPLEAAYYMVWYTINGVLKYRNLH